MHNKYSYSKSARAGTVASGKEVALLFANVCMLLPLQGTIPYSAESLIRASIPSLTALISPSFEDVNLSQSFAILRCVVTVQFM